MEISYVNARSDVFRMVIVLERCYDLFEMVIEVGFGIKRIKSQYIVCLNSSKRPKRTLTKSYNKCQRVSYGGPTRPWLRTRGFNAEESCGRLRLMADLFETSLSVEEVCSKLFYRMR
jgi:hypothetical protein